MSRCLVESICTNSYSFSTSTTIRLQKAYLISLMTRYYTLSSWVGSPRCVNKFAVLHAIYMELAPINLACKRTHIIYIKFGSLVP